MEMFEALSCGWAETHLGALWYLSPSQPWHSLSRLKACIMMTYKSHASRGVIKTPQYVPVAFCAAHLDERKMPRISCCSAQQGKSTTSTLDRPWW